MSKICAKCNKTVYPTEELKCLDKIWHSGCFRCTECSLKLTMKNYKGYLKLPYCNAHYPTTKHTQVDITPEMSRVSNNTKMQSQIKYKEAFEQDVKGKKTSVNEDPELSRLKQNTINASNIVYHAKYETDLRGKKTSVTDDPEHMRLQKNTIMSSEVSYHGLKEKRIEAEKQRETIHQSDVRTTHIQRQPPGIAANNADESSPYSSRNSGTSVIYNSSGKVSDTAPGARRIGSIADYDPINVDTGNINSSSGQSKNEWVESAPLPNRYSGAEQNNFQPPPQHSAPAVKQSPRWRAIFSYNAADDDEVTFREGDIIINGERIDDGWMTGTVLRTGCTGMLPSNYVEQV